MKKILSLLSTISLSTIITTNIIACNIPNTNNKNNKPNKPIEHKFTPEQPPKGNNWKLITDWKDEEKNRDKKYIGIWKNGLNYEIINWKANPAQPKWPLYNFKTVYRWDVIGEPTTPTINKNNGEITNWNE